MIKVRIPGQQGQKGRLAWLSYHHYPFEDDLDLLHRFRYQPTVMTMPDGRMIELLYSRRSAPLPSNIELTGFDVASHIGGFTGEVSSVLNWISNVRFEDEAGEQQRENERLKAQLAEQTKAPPKPAEKTSRACVIS